EPLGFTAPPVPQRRRGKLCAFALLVKLKVFISSKTFSLFSLTPQHNVLCESAQTSYFQLVSQVFFKLFKKCPQLSMPFLF
ncbi:MAG: hypothetical protein PHN64_10660, partial [Desulfovibrionaceae bacterium]|nr:hypothetical protein [Desulfovibrionaceae bacterium]